MNLEESIIYAIEHFSKDILGEAKLVNILADLNVYKEHPAYKRVLTEIINDGTTTRLFVRRDNISDVEIRQAIINVNKQYGFQQDIIEDVLLSIKNALLPTDKRDDFQPQNFDYIGTEDEYGYRDVSLNGKWGFIDGSNKIVVPLTYNSVSSFHEGLAAVECKGRYGYIDLQGKLVIPLQFDLGYSFAADIAKVKNAGLFGLIDKNGKIVLPIEYDSIRYVSNGYIAIQKSGKWGFADTQGKVRIPPKYKKVIKQFTKGLAAVDDGNSTIVIDKEGNIKQYL